MTGRTQQQPESGSSQPEQYVHGFDAQTLRRHAGRTAATHATFFLPFLRKGVSLLDCGSGPGTITVGLAQAIAPGEVVGIDMEPSVIDLARAHAVEHGVSNVRFEVADVYDLPFPDDSFDAVFSHNVLEHLKEPLTALNEMRRVLKPGGVIGARDADSGGVIIEPSDPTLEESLALHRRVWEHNGGNPRIGRQLRSLFRGAGFARVKVSASYDVDSTPEEIQRNVELVRQRYEASPFAKQAVDLGWADRAVLQRMIGAFEAWGEHPDALLALSSFEAVGWKD